MDSTTVPDPALLFQSLRAKSPAAGELLSRSYRESLLRFCWGYLGRAEDAEDAVQEILLKILSCASVPDHLHAWIYKLARNHCLNALRGRGRRHDHELFAAAGSVFDAWTGMLTRLVRREQRSRVAHLLAALSDAQREVLRLRYVENLSRAAIAEVLELPESLVRSRLFEGVRKLREHARLIE